MAFPFWNYVRGKCTQGGGTSAKPAFCRDSFHNPIYGFGVLAGWGEDLAFTPCEGQVLMRALVAELSSTGLTSGISSLAAGDKKGCALYFQLWLPLQSVE